eukprot:2896759-Amphidinium_carterae.1
MTNVCNTMHVTVNVDQNRTRILPNHFRESCCFAAVVVVVAAAALLSSLLLLSVAAVGWLLLGLAVAH